MKRYKVQLVRRVVQIKYPSTDAISFLEMKEAILEGDEGLVLEIPGGLSAAEQWQVVSFDEEEASSK